MYTQIYCRITGYVVTIVLHIANIMVMISPSKEMLEDYRLKEFMELQYRYLTCWTFFFQIVHAVTGLTCDFLTLRNSEKKHYKATKYLKEFRDTLFLSIVWPLTVLVFVVFWTIYNYDRNLIFPAYLDKHLQPWNNHIMHTAILPLAVWELLFQPRTKPRSHLPYVALLTAFLTVYLAVLIYTYIEKGKWSYIILERAYGTMYFHIFIFFNLVIASGSYILQWSLVTQWKTSEKSKKNVG